MVQPVALPISLAYNTFNPGDTETVPTFFQLSSRSPLQLKTTSFYTNLASSPGLVESVPVPILNQSQSQAQNVFPSANFTSEFPGLVETVPIPILIGNVPAVIIAPAAVNIPTIGPPTPQFIPSIVLVQQADIRKLPQQFRSQIQTGLVVVITPPPVAGQLPIWPLAYSPAGSSVSEWPWNIIDTTNA